MIGVLSAPESPWWLTRHEKSDQARRSLLRLASTTGGDFNVDETVAMMQHTNEVEKSLSRRSLLPRLFQEHRSSPNWNRLCGLHDAGAVRYRHHRLRGILLSPSRLFNGAGLRSLHGHVRPGNYRRWVRMDLDALSPSPDLVHHQLRHVLHHHAAHRDCWLSQGIQRTESCGGGGP